LMLKRNSKIHTEKKKDFIRMYTDTDPEKSLHVGFTRKFYA
jgi:hypothetical protein